MRGDLVLLTLLFGIAACTGKSDGADQGATWLLRPHPLGDAEEQEFGNLTQILATSHYLIAVDAQANQLMIFDPSGNHVAQKGRGGNGPGEFASLDVVAAYRGDSVAVYDGSNRRITVVPLLNGTPRSFPLPVDRGVWLSGTLADSMFVMFGGMPAKRPEQRGFYWDSAFVLIVSPQGASMDTVSRLPNRYDVAGPGRPFMLLAPAGQLKASREEFCHASSDKPRVICFGRGGAVVSSFDWDQPLRPVTREVKDTYKDFYIASAPPFPRDQLAERLKDVVWPDSLPAVGYPILVADDGAKWIPEYPLLSEGQARRWRIFSPDGELLAHATTPKEFEPSDVRDNIMYGVWRDSLGVTTARAFRIAQ